MPLFHTHEVTSDPVSLSRYSNEQGLYQQSSDEDYIRSIQLKKLCTRLNTRLMQLAKEKLTKHQYEVMTLILMGKSYHEAAIILDINYTAISHAVRGILQSGNRYGGLYHGGIYKKLQKKCAKDVTIQRLLFKIHILTHPS